MLTYTRACHPYISRNIQFSRPSSFTGYWAYALMDSGSLRFSSQTGRWGRKGREFTPAITEKPHVYELRIWSRQGSSELDVLISLNGQYRVATAISISFHVDNCNGHAR